MKVSEEKLLQSISEVSSHYEIGGRMVSAARIGNGHINDTFRVIYAESSGTKSYTFQKVNDFVFAKPEIIMDNIKIVSDYINEKYGENTVSLTLRDQYRNMAEVVLSYPEILELARNAVKAVGREPVSCPVRGGTDGATLSFMGLPCPNLGTGGYNFHGVHECIPVESLEAMVQVLCQLVGSFIE